jgi:hypothetical protein
MKRSERTREILRFAQNDVGVGCGVGKTYGEI